MDTNFLKNFLIQSGQCWDICSYKIPKFILNKKASDNNIIELDKIWEKSIKNNKSPFQDNWINYLKSINRDKSIINNYIQEFPFIIDNEDLWIECCKQFEVSDKYYKTNYFLADFFFPKLGVIVEIDSGYHYTKRNYDSARNSYIYRRYGIRTLRVDNFDLTQEDSKKFTKIFIDTVQSMLSCKKYSNIPLDSYYPVDNMDYIIKDWINNNTKLYSIFTYLEPRVLKGNCNIVVGRDELESIFGKFCDEYISILENNFLSIYKFNLKII